MGCRCLVATDAYQPIWNGLGWRAVDRKMVAFGSPNRLACLLSNEFELVQFNQAHSLLRDPRENGFRGVLGGTRHLSAEARVYESKSNYLPPSTTCGTFRIPCGSGMVI